MDACPLHRYNSLEMLKKIEQLCEAPVSDLFDLICGTSAGGATAACITVAAPDGLTAVKTLLDELAVNVFPRSSVCGLLATGQKVKQKYVDTFCGKVQKLLNIDDAVPLRPPNDGADGRPKVPYCFVCSTSMDTESKYRHLAPFVIANYERTKEAFPILGSHSPATWPAIVAMQATTAAPGYFSAVHHMGKHYVDGAVCANNPTALALSEAAALWPGRPIQLICSLGVGENPDGELDDISSGMVYWMGQLTSLALSSQKTHDAVVATLPLLHPQPVYFRFDPPTGGYALDEARPDVLEKMRTAARTFIAEQSEDFERLASALRPRPKEPKERTLVRQDRERKVFFVQPKVVTAGARLAHARLTRDATSGNLASRSAPPRVASTSRLPAPVSVRSAASSSGAAASLVASAAAAASDAPPGHEPGASPPHATAQETPLLAGEASVAASASQASSEPSCCSSSEVGIMVGVMPAGAAHRDSRIGRAREGVLGGGGAPAPRLKADNSSIDEAGAASAAAAPPVEEESVYMDAVSQLPRRPV